MSDTFPLCKHLDSLVDALRNFVPAALQEFDEDSIHKARVTTRRLKAAIEMLNSLLNPEHARLFARVGKRLRRRLGPLRDLDVMLGHLDEIKPGQKLAPAAEWLRQQFQDERQHERERATHLISVGKVLTRLGSWSAVRQDVAAAEAAAGGLLDESVHTKLDEFIGQADALGNGADPHQLRIAGKSLRYTLELAKAAGRKLPPDVLRSFKRMQDLLGTWHDYVVLASRAMETCVERELPLHHPQMQRQMLELCNHFMKRSQRLLDHFAQLWKEKGPELAKGIRATFLRIETPIEPQTGPDPAGSEPPPATEVVSPVEPPAV